MAPEAIFEPKLINSTSGGIQAMALDSVLEVDIDVRRDLFLNIILSGGSTMFEGFGERFSKEIENQALTKQIPAHTAQIKVVCPADRKNSSWVGGSILSSLSTFESQWITNDDYEENGSEIVHRKCV